MTTRKPFQPPFRVLLTSRGNPDFRQYAPISPPEIVTGTLAAILEAAEKYRYDWELGIGNWPMPPVKDANGRRVGYLAFNGTLWSTQDILGVRVDPPEGA